MEEKISILPVQGGFEVKVQHLKTGDSYGVIFSNGVYEQLRQHFIQESYDTIIGKTPPPKNIFSLQLQGK